MIIYVSSLVCLINPWGNKTHLFPFLQCWEKYILTPNLFGKMHPFSFYEDSQKVLEYVITDLQRTSIAFQLITLSNYCDLYFVLLIWPLSTHNCDIFVSMLNCIFALDTQIKTDLSIQIIAVITDHYSLCCWWEVRAQGLTI